MDAINVYSIKDLENFSGIKAHTIRIWEKRYSILVPDRTDTNIRTYTEGELKKILNVAYLNRNGVKISKIARLREDELTSRVMEISSRNDERNSNFQPGKILMSALKFSEEQFREVLLPIISKYGAEEAYLKYLGPLVEKAGILWQTGSLSRAQEQFVRNSIRQVLISEDTRLKPPSSSANNTVAMVNPSESFQDCNFLFYKYVLRKRGFDVIYTGGILPPSEVLEIHKVRPFSYLVVNAGSFDFANRKVEYFSRLGKSLGLKKVIFSDYSFATDRKKSEKVIVSSGPKDFITKLSNLH